MARAVPQEWLHLELDRRRSLVLGYADQIRTGAELRQSGAGSTAAKGAGLSRGVADLVAKSIAYRLEPALSIAEPVRLVCSEGKFADLLAQLAFGNRLDFGIDETHVAPAQCQGFQSFTGQTAMVFCAPALRRALQGSFPECLNDFRCSSRVHRRRYGSSWKMV